MIYEVLTILASANRNRLKANLNRSCVTIPLLKYVGGNGTEKDGKPG